MGRASEAANFVQHTQAHSEEDVIKNKNTFMIDKHFDREKLT